MDRLMHTRIGVTPAQCVLNKRRAPKRLVASASLRNTVRRVQKRNGTPPIRIPSLVVVNDPQASRRQGNRFHRLPDDFDTDTSGTAND